MRSSAAGLVALAGVIGCALGIACGSSADSAGFDDGTPGGSTQAPPPLGGDGSSGAAATPQGPAATGVVLVHAALFPRFRLCFSNQLDLQPQPDSKVMPDSNVVGVEQGSVIRIDPLDAPGEVFVIDERRVETTPGDHTAPACKKLICGIPGADPAGGATCLVKRSDYDSAGRIDRPLGTTGVEVMGITGCGNEFMVTDPRVKGSTADCGSPYDNNLGNLKIQTVSLPPVTPATKTTIPVQLVHMSFLLEAQKGTSDLDVKFGTLATMPSTPIATNPPIFKGGSDTSLSVDQTDDAVYAQQGFRITIQPGDGGAPTFTKDLTLADVQALSSPREVPSDYYTVASNYALLLLGDSRITDDARRGVHILAVPVLDPSQLDAGTEGGEAGDP